MDFCQKCGSRLIPKKGKSGNQALLILACNKCGQKTKETKENIKIKGKAIQFNGKKQCSPSERSFKKVLANSGYSEAIADKICKCYNLQS